MREALQVLENSKIKIILLVDEQNRLKGTCTDGDFRRAILKHGTTEGAAIDAANTTPFSVNEHTNPGALKALLRERNIKHIPLVDDDGTLKGLYVDNGYTDIKQIDIPVVLMAGGLGSRLRPLTDKCPKPLLPLGNKPILEHIILRFKDQGFKRFYISVNYLGHMIEEYFGSGDRWGVNISYLREDKRLGTGGALDLLPQNMHYPFLVMNGDLLTETDFRELAAHHIATQAAATMCVREYHTTIPFGVVKFEGSNYLGTDEKPTLKHYINTGVYCVSKVAREHVPSNEFYDMPTLFSDLEEAGSPCSVHLIRDSWIDIGSIPEYEAAQNQYAGEDKS